MLKQTVHLVVKTDEVQGFVFIEGSDETGNGSTVVVSPDQISLLIEWLHEAKAEVDALDKRKRTEKS